MLETECVPKFVVNLAHAVTHEYKVRFFILLRSELMVGFVHFAKYPFHSILVAGELARSKVPNIFRQTRHAFRMMHETWIALLVLLRSEGAFSARAARVLNFPRTCKDVGTA